MSWWLMFNRNAAPGVRGEFARGVATISTLALCLVVTSTTLVRAAVAEPLFAAPIKFGTGNSPHSVAIGDLDGDGKLELAVANYTHVSWQGGIGVECAFITPARNTTWGAIKAIYR
jgi:hypothetical protein